MENFSQFLERMNHDKYISPLMDSGEDEKSLIVLKVGKDLHDKKATSFWDELISLCSNAEGLSQLLGVSKEKISSWPSRIKQMQQKLDRYNAENPHGKLDKKVIPTGDNGAFTTNSDPNLNANKLF